MLLTCTVVLVLCGIVLHLLSSNQVECTEVEGDIYVGKGLDGELIILKCSKVRYFAVQIELASLTVYYVAK